MGSTVILKFKFNKQLIMHITIPFRIKTIFLSSRPLIVIITLQLIVIIIIIISPIIYILFQKSSINFVFRSDRLYFIDKISSSDNWLEIFHYSINTSLGRHLQFKINIGYPYLAL